MEEKRGRITTFYSHKGGTGRSMALANVACLLSRRADVARVLAIDWDLEAPGLHWFFRTPGPKQADNGLIDIFAQLETGVGGDSQDPLSEESAKEIVQRIQLEDYVVETGVPRVYLIPAGAFGPQYGEKVSAFDWRRLFRRAPSLIRIFAEFLAARYDYVLVDSRTGFNDMSGICTALLPDQLVLVFTPNRQSLIGGLEAVKRAASYRTQSDDLRPLAVFPLPSRIDVSEPELLDKWRFGDPGREEDDQGYQRRFETLLADVYGLTSCDLKNYFDDVQIQHVPRYAYGEEIAALRERGTRLSVSRSYATLADILARQESPWMRPASTQGGAELVSGADPTLVKVQAMKEYLPEERFKLKLFDLLANETRDVLLQGKSFDVNERPTPESVAKRLHTYETITNDLVRLQALLGYWGESYHRAVLGLAPKRLCEQILTQSGMTIWLALRWYPAMLLMYSGGIAAVAGGRYENLRDLMRVPVANVASGTNVESPLFRILTEARLELHRTDAFKILPGLERRHTPMSDYLFDMFRPIMDELLFLSTAYEQVFDRFEMLYALEYAHVFENPSGVFRYWGPVGRFAWKGAPFTSAVDAFIAEAEAEGETWPPVRAGLFGGSTERFLEVGRGYSQVLKQNPLI